MADSVETCRPPRSPAPKAPPASWPSHCAAGAFCSSALAMMTDLDCSAAGGGGASLGLPGLGPALAPRSGGGALALGLLVALLVLLAVGGVGGQQVGVVGLVGAVGVGRVVLVVVERLGVHVGALLDDGELLGLHRPLLLRLHLQLHLLLLRLLLFLLLHFHLSSFHVRRRCGRRPRAGVGYGESLLGVWGGNRAFLAPSRGAGSGSVFTFTPSDFPSPSSPASEMSE
ncbi:hypothetical protein EYF80_032325 [Liparis tanakae]|uniref:Uncharacterized protein n=1 Tax=Liparis tanakae TaxID=230148 RepID=A0A4Z2GW34_9TELE|nr:hypothetical protein EYF80_032325 [Liparis tanakae]